jgi:phage gp36-like protein
LPLTTTLYADEADLEELGVGPTLLEDQSITADAVAKNLLAASRTADGYLDNGTGYPYTLPLVQVGVDLKLRVAWIAAWTLVSSAGFAPEEGADNVYRQRYEDAIKWLEGVRDGDIISVDTIGTTPGPPTAAAAARRPVVISGSSRGFSTRGEGDLTTFDLTHPRGGFQGD